MGFEAIEVSRNYKCVCVCVCVHRRDGFRAACRQALPSEKPNARVLRILDFLSPF